MHGCTNVGVSGGHGAYFSLPWYILHVPILYLSLCVLIEMFEECLPPCLIHPSIRGVFTKAVNSDDPTYPT